MTSYLTNRDGGKTNQEGHIRFQTKVWNGNVVSGLQALVRSPLAMGVNISIGDAKVDYSTYGFTVWTDAIEAVSIATADPSNPRIDTVVGYVDMAVTPSSTNTNNPGLLKFKSVAGTPAASPSSPSGATIQASVGASNPYFTIANVLVGTGVTTIDNTKITDTRVIININGSNIADNSVSGSKLSSYKVSRQNNTTNTSLTNARIETGWGWMQFTSSVTVNSELVSFGTSFNDKPIVVVTFGGDAGNVPAVYGTGGNNIQGPSSAKAVSITNNGFTAYVWANSSWSANDTVYYQWIAIGN